MEYYEALGNRYLVTDVNPSASEICALCATYKSDGLLYHDGYRLHIYNRDGSEAERSGNGVRIYGYHCWRSGKLRRDEPCVIQTSSGIVRCSWLGELAGRADCWLIGADLGDFFFRAHSLEVEALGRKWRGFVVHVGNPHFVLEQREELINWRSVSAALENASVFPNRMNVQWVKIQSPSFLDLRVWERGVGETSSCGTGACAAAIYGHYLRDCNSRIVVRMVGGQLVVRFRSHRPTICGPVTPLS